MGSKTPEDHRQGPDPSSAHPIAALNPPKPAVASGLLPGVLEGQDEDGDDDGDNDKSAEPTLTLANGEPSKGNKKKKRKFSKKKAKKAQQTTPPRVPLADLFPNQQYPEGEIAEYAERNLQRTTAEEIRHLSAIKNMDAEFLNDYRKAAEVHRQVRQHVQTIAKPGISMSQLADEIEDGVRALTGHQALDTGDALKAGMGFPTGLSLNNVAAHWTPNPGTKEVILQYDDVLKVDFGVHVNGRIVDSAFTVAPNPVYENLLIAVKAATNTGLKEAGIDARISHISAAIQMESYEVELNGKTVPVKAMRGLSGHNILRYKIHGDKQVPFVKTKTSQRMEEGDVFAIETFGTTGTARLRDDLHVYGYGRNEGASLAGVHNHQASAKALLKTIDDNFGTLVFSKRYLERVGAKNYHLGMKSLISNGVVECYGPLVDVPGSYVAQFEHTVLLRPNFKEVISRGDDY